MAATNFIAWVNLQPPITDERRKTVIVHGNKKYDGETTARITKDGLEIATVKVRPIDCCAVFSFKTQGHSPPFLIEIRQADRTVDRGTITEISESH